MASQSQDKGSSESSLADRISKPESRTVGGLGAGAAPFQPKSGKLWSDETNSPVSPVATAPIPAPGAETLSKKTAPSEQPKPASMPQSDGATTPFNGSILEESEYSVQIKLADLQADPNNPLYSVSTFEELNL